MRTILKKSGSESETFDTTDFKDNGFNLYSSTNSDPLLNLDVLGLSEPVNNSQENVLNKSKLRLKSPLTRSVSESVVSRSLKENSVSEIVDDTIHEDDVFPVKSSESMTEEKVKIKERELEASRSIFSDSETVETIATGSKTAKERKAKHTHKRSRSDISGIKTASIEKEMSATNEKQPANESSGIFAFVV